MRFQQRRLLQAVLLDPLDLVYRLLARKRHLPPYSLRAFVGGARGYDTVGPWFLREFKRLGLLTPRGRILDIGCGCGRLAVAFARDAELRAQEVSYVGMDVDRRCVAWCTNHLTTLNPRFTFLHADLRNRTYNPRGKVETRDYRFPFAAGAFDLILLTSVFTHLLEAELCHYLDEAARLLTPQGRIYASFYTYRTKEEALGGVPRHAYTFPCCQGHYALHRSDEPEAAVAYHEGYLRELVAANGLMLAAEMMYGLQDAMILKRA